MTVVVRADGIIIGKLAPGASLSFTESYVIAGGTPGTVSNTATATRNTRNDSFGLTINSEEVHWTFNAWPSPDRRFSRLHRFHRQHGLGR